MKHIIYDIKMDSMGGIIGTPRNKRERRRIARHMLQMTGHANASFYLQEGFGVGEFLENEIRTPRELRDLEEGYTVSWLVDPWVYAHYFSYDCHTLYE